MSEILYIILSTIVGILLGILFFGGLWLTIKKGLTAKMPAALFIISFLLRTGITLLGFYFVASGDWRKMAGCLIGFIIGRFFVKHLTKSEIKVNDLKGNNV